MAERILVIGGVAAGLSAASRARRCAPRARITVLERGPAAGYGACGLPAFLAGEASLESLRAHPPEEFRERRGLDVRLGEEAFEIIPSRRQVRARRGDGEAAYGYDALIVATGATSALTIEGGDHPFLFAANTWEQAARLDEFLRARRPRTGVVIGAGYIGLEVAEALTRRGVSVRILERGTQILPSFGAGATTAMQAALSQSARLDLGVAARRARSPRAEGVRLETTAGDVDADFAVDCAGLRPNTALAAAAGAALGATGALAVDERQQTNLPAIWAAGDCAESRHRVSGRACWIPLGAPANQQGRVAGQNAAGGPPARHPGVLGALAVRAFGIEMGRVGLNAAQARAAGFSASEERIEAKGRAGYMGREAVTLTATWEAGNGRLLGCEVVGAPGTVMARLNAAAVALTAGMTREQIETLDLAYAPAIAPLFDPLLIAARKSHWGPGR